MIPEDADMDQPVDSMVFEGSEQVIELLRALYVRNGRSEHLPMVSLVRPDLDDQPLALKYLSSLYHRRSHTPCPCRARTPEVDVIAHA
jgi:hypothetical protein